MLFSGRLVLTMFFGLFRKSNVLAPVNRFDPAKHLCRSDIIAHPWGLEVIIKWSKTLQFRERNVSVPLPYMKGHPLCPTTAVVHAFSLQPHYLGQLLLFPLCLGCNLWGTHNLSKCFVSSWKTLVCRLKCLRATVSAEEVHFSQCRQAYWGKSWCNWGSCRLMLVSSISKFPSLSKILVCKNCPSLASVVMFTYTFLCGTIIFL